MIITTHLIMMFLPYMVIILHWYFKFMNPSWQLNSKRQPRQNVLKRYRKQFYQQKIKTRKFFPAKNKLLENTDEATCPMTKRNPEINRYLLSNLRCYLAPEKHWRKNFDTDSFEICANSGASSCATHDEIYFIPGTYKHFTGIKIYDISEVLKVPGYGSVSWIFQYNKKETIDISIEEVLPIRLICP